MSIVILGVDLGKNSCSIVGVDAAGPVDVGRAMRRQTLIDYVLKVPSCVAAMEGAAARIISDVYLPREVTKSA